MPRCISIPVDRVSEVLRYDPESGRFFWKKKTADKVVVGREAGNATGRRDVRISIDGVLYQAHRLAWVIMTGDQPPACIDHVNGDSRDNRWGNLREATISQNGANRNEQSNSATGTKGVHFYPGRAKPWLARLRCRGKMRLNRYYATKDEAESAYSKAAKQHFGEFART